MARSDTEDENTSQFRELEMTTPLRASAPGAKLPNYLQILAGIP